MKSHFLATRKIIEGNVVVDMKGYQFSNQQVDGAIRKLREIYNDGDGWKLLCWMENCHGRKLIDFEMEAERIGGRGEHVLFSMVRMEEPVRRYR